MSAFQKENPELLAQPGAPEDAASQTAIAKAKANAMSRKITRPRQNRTKADTIEVPIFSSASKVLPILAKVLPSCPLPPNANRVLTALLGFVNGHGYAWPSRRTLCQRTGIPSPRLITRAVVQLKHAICMETQLISQGQLLPNGVRANSNLLVYFIDLEKLTDRIKGLEKGPMMIGRGPYGHGVSIRSRGEGSIRSPPPPYRICPSGTISSSLSSSPLSRPVVPRGALPPAPSPPTPRTEGEGGAALAAPQIPRSRSGQRKPPRPPRDRSARGSHAKAAFEGPRGPAILATLEHWRRELCPTWGKFTRRQIECVEARLEDGFSADDLERVALSAKRSAWNRERPHGFNVGTIYGSADAVQTLLAKAPPKKRAGSPVAPSPDRQETKNGGAAAAARAAKDDVMVTPTRALALTGGGPPIRTIEQCKNVATLLAALNG